MQGSTQKHILVLAYYFPPLGLSGVQRIAKLVKYLPSNGWKVTVITPEPGSYFAFDERLLAELTSNPDIHIERTQSWDPTRLIRPRESNVIPFPEETSRKLFSKLSQWLMVPDNKIGWKRFAVKRAMECHAKNPFNLVLATAPPYTCLLAGKEIATRLGIPLVLDYRDDWIENPRHNYPTSWHKAISLRQERLAISSSKLVFTINKHIAHSIQGRHPRFAARVTVLPQGFDPADFQARPAVGIQAHAVSTKNHKEQTTHLKRMTFLYAGMFYDAQQPDSFLRALHHVLERKPEYKTVVRARFVGLFPDSGKQLIRELDLESVVELSGYLNHDESVKALMECDVPWMIVGRQKGEEGISTGKLFEYMGSRKPILGLLPDGVAKDALVAYGNAKCAYPDDVESISGAIEAFVAQWHSGNLKLANAKNLDQYDRKKQAAKIAALFLDLML